MLYEWLAQTDEGRFDRAFQRYYREASMQLVRYLARRSSLPDLDCEQIAVDALLKFFDRIGRERRLAADRVKEALATIKPPTLDAFHGRQVQRWTADVEVFRKTSMSFVPPSEDSSQPLKPLIQTVNEAIPGLRRQGCLVLDGVRGVAKEATSPLTVDAAGDDDASIEEDSLPHYHALRQFARTLRATHAFSPFVAGTWTVIETLPVLRVPSNGYLFDIAHTLYLDECKARGRRKRGGSGYAPGEASVHPVLAPADDDRAWPDDSDEDSGSYTLAAAGLAQATPDISMDQSDEDFCESFYAFLRKPLTDAEDAYHRAAERGRAEAERKRLESIGRKNERLMTVLALRIEGHTQDAIADTLGISRNQVKYIVEGVQAAYQDFCDRSQREQRA